MSGRLRGKAQKDIDGETLEVWADDVWAEEDTERRISLAFGNLLNAVFFEEAEIASEIMDLQSKLSNATTDKSKQDLRVQIERVMQGMSQKRFKKSEYFTGSLSMEWKETPYLVLPTELLARAFEGYIANKMEVMHQSSEYLEASGQLIMPGVEYLSSPNWYYAHKMSENSKVTHAMEMIYPKDGERTAIFDAFDTLFDSLKRDYFAGEAASAEPSRVATMNVGNIDLEVAQKKILPLPSKEAKKEADRLFRASKRDHQRLHERAKEGDPHKNLRGHPILYGLAKTEDNIGNQFLASKTAILLNLRRRNEDKPEVHAAMTEIMRRLIDDPGARDLLVVESTDGFVGNYTEVVKSEIRRGLDEFARILKKHDANNFTDEQHLDLRLLMTSDPETIGAARKGEIDKKVLELAGDLRTHLNKLFQYGKDYAGISFLEDNAYLPRILDIVRLNADSDKFKEQSMAMFKEVLWEKEVGKLRRMDSSDIAQLDVLSDTVVFESLLTTLLKVGAVANLERMRFQRQPSRDEVSTNEALGIRSRRINEYLEFHEELKVLFKEYKKAESDLEESGGDPAALNELQEALIDLVMENEELIEEGYDAVGDGWSDEASRDWKRRIDLQEADDPAYASPFASDFTKQRKFPKEADTYMVEFYRPALESIASYTQAVVKKTEFEKRFSSDLIEKHHKGVDRNATKGRDGKLTDVPRNYLEWLIDEKMTKNGMDKNDVILFREQVNNILGRGSMPSPNGYALVNKVHTFTLMALLSKAALTSLAEPLFLGVRTRSTTLGLKNLALTMQEAFAYANKDAAQKVQLRHQLSNIFGIVDAAGTADIALNRLGGMMVEDAILNRRVSFFFKWTGLQGLTNAQRRSSMAVGFQYFKEMASQYMNPIGKTDKAKNRNKSEAKREFLDYGIPDGRIDEFLEWFMPTMQGKSMPDVSDIVNLHGQKSEMGEILSVAVNRMVNRTIQDPDISSSPRYAEHPLGRLTYSIMRFSYSVHKNIVKAEYRRIVRAGEYDSVLNLVKDPGSKNVARRIDKLLNKKLSRGEDYQRDRRDKARGMVEESGIGNPDKAALLAFISRGGFQDKTTFSEAKLRQMQVMSQLAGPLVSLYVAQLLVTTAREFLGNYERWEKWEKDGTLVENLMELAFSRTGITGAFDPFIQIWRSMRYNWHFGKLVLGATAGTVADEVWKIVKLTTDRNSPNTTTAEKRAVEAGIFLAVYPFIIAMITNPYFFGGKLGVYEPLARGTTAWSLLSHSSRDMASDLIIDSVYGEQEEKGKLTGRTFKRKKRKKREKRKKY